MIEKKNKILIIGILVIIIIGIGGFLIFKKIMPISKIDSSKDWVYDAEYEKNVEEESYTTTYNETYYVKDIVVPFLNVDSDYAKNSNNEIKEVLDEAVEIYNEGVNDKLTYVDQCNYQKNIFENKLSVIMTYGVGGTDIVYPNYYTYNIDLKTGKKLSYEEIYKMFGFDSNTISQKVEDAISIKLQEKLNEVEETDFEAYYNASISNYKNSISNNTLKYFVSEDKKLNIIVTLSIPVGIGELDTIIKID